MLWYDKIDTAPLRLHSAMRFFILPLLMVIFLVLFIVQTINNFNSGETAYPLIFFAYLIPFAIYFLIFIGFFSWQKFAWILMMVASAIGTIICAAGSISLAILASHRNYPDWYSDLTTVYTFNILLLTFAAIVLTAANVLIFIYYLKRRKLFFSEKAHEPFPPPLVSNKPKTVELNITAKRPPKSTLVPDSNIAYKHNSFDYLPPHQLNTCPVCNAAIPKGALACDNCGFCPGAQNISSQD